MPNLSSFKTIEERNAWYRGYRARHREHFREYNKKYNKEWRKENGYHSEEKWKQNNPEKIKAQEKAQRAKREGILIPQPCEICLREDGKLRTVVVMHHDDYSKPLEVRWLCHIHHRDVHYGEQEAEKLSVEK